MSKKNIPVFDETGIKVGMASENADAEIVLEEPSFRTSLPRKHEYPENRIVLSGFDFSQRGDWHNLTEAIAAGEPIDFEKLDGQKVRMANEDGREISGYKLERVPGLEPQDASEWVLNKQIEGDIQPYTFINAWRGKGGWTLWVDGEIPMLKQTAEQLPFGTEFMGKNQVNEIYQYVRVVGGVVQRVDTAAGYTALGIEVAEVLGMYGQKESE